MKPFQIFEKHPDVDAYRFGPSFTPYAIVVKEKRLTDAELAAEYQRICHEFDIAKCGLEYDHWPGMAWDADDIGDRHDILYRFATLPHHDEQ